MKVNLMRTRYAGKESTTGLMENSSPDSGLKIKCMATALLSGLMVEHTKETLFKIRETEKAQ
jgi:hypothetical protein